EQTMLNTLGYYMHAGGHGTIPSDWPVFIEYMKKYL
ncbi:MAG: acetylxylan esterase, partial [Segetibacter sp.]|nr:acetylxylan esterase [Segetibacter sp.]